MESVLRFFSDLILFTGGLVVITIWIFILVGLAIEIWDLITGGKKED